ncbi:MAG TPA: ABC transporter permease [Pseudonocardiaceae bacterium]|jgi:peptide/nickel transport system permease protein
MINFILRRLGISVLLLAIVSVIVFVVLRVLPGDPTITLLGGAQGTDPAQVAQVRHQLGLDRSLPAQYWQWVDGLLHGHLGISYFSQTSVNSLVAQRIGPTLELALVAIVAAVLIAVPLAVLAALRPGGPADRVVAFFTTVTMAVPPFLVAIILVVLFAVRLRLLPSRGYVPFATDPGGNVQMLILPALTLALAAAAPILRFLRASLADVAESGYLLTAEGKGLPWGRALVTHALPNALLPTLTVVGMTIGQLLGGVVVIEYIFGWPGLGSLIVNSVLKRDYAVLQTSVLFAAGAFLLCALAVDVLYGVIDPRLRVRRKVASS